MVTEKKIKSPDERRIKELYGDNQKGATRYRRGGDNAGRIIQKNREKQNGDTKTAYCVGSETLT